MTASTTFDPNDPRLTAYALGELYGDEITEFERLLAESSASRDALAEIRETTGWLRSELAAEPAFTLSAEQNQRLEEHLTLGTGAEEKPLSPQGRGEGTKPALADASPANTPLQPSVTVAPANLRREQARHRWAVLAAAAATAALSAAVMFWPATSPRTLNELLTMRDSQSATGQRRGYFYVKENDPNVPQDDVMSFTTLEDRLADLTPHPGVVGSRRGRNAAFGESNQPQLDGLSAASNVARNVQDSTPVGGTSDPGKPRDGKPVLAGLATSSDGRSDAWREGRSKSDSGVSSGATTKYFRPGEARPYYVTSNDQKTSQPQRTDDSRDGRLKASPKFVVVEDPATKRKTYKASPIADGKPSSATNPTVSAGEGRNKAGSTSKLFGAGNGKVPSDGQSEEQGGPSGKGDKSGHGERGESSGKTSKFPVVQDGDNRSSSEEGKPSKGNGSHQSGLAKPSPSDAKFGDGYSLDLAKGEKRRETLAVTPRIIIQEEESELFGLPASDESKKSAAPAQFNERVPDFGTEAYAPIVENPFLTPAEQPLSTFSVDVDTASYANVRRFLNQGQLPPADAVRIEELVNYFKYDDPAPIDGQPFRVVAEAAPCPWQREHYVARISLKAKEIAKAQRPPTNLVFLLDVSGSMQPDNKLPLVKRAMSLLIEELSERDRVSIVTYAGDAGLKLEPTIGSDQTKIMQAIAALSAGGSTNGAAGIHLAYEQALRHFSKDSANRVILCTDGDFNVGVSSDNELVTLIEDQAKSGVFLSIFGFGMGNLKDSKLEKLADKGNGHYGYIDDLNEARKNFNEELMGTLYTVAKDVKLQVEFNPLTVGAYRLIGYENRVMAAEDFNNDAKDAGEIGAGHTVTALYEIVPRGKWKPVQPVDPLKYATPEAKNPSPPAPLSAKPRRGENAQLNEPIANIPPEAADDLFTVKLRYKQPDAAASVRTVDVVVDDIAGKKVTPSRDLLWSASVASFGMQLSHSKHAGTWTMADVLETARGAKGNDTTGRRSEFVELVKAATKLMPSPPGKGGQ